MRLIVIDLEVFYSVAFWLVFPFTIELVGRFEISGVLTTMGTLWVHVDFDGLSTPPRRQKQRFPQNEIIAAVVFHSVSVGSTALPCFYLLHTKCESTLSSSLW